MFMDKTSAIESLFRIRVIHAKPHERLPTSPVYSVHELNLGGALFDIILIDTDAVHPEHSWIGTDLGMEA